MLNIFETTIWIVSLVGIVFFAGALYLVGTPPIAPHVSQESREKGKKDYMAQLTKEQRIEIAQINNKNPEVPDDFKISKKKPKEKFFEVDRTIFLAVSNLNGAQHQADLAKSRIKDGGLQIFEFDKRSILSKIGFEEKDVITLIDGEYIDFEAIKSPTGALQGKALYERLRDKFEEGLPLRIDITRNGSPVQITVSMKDF